MNLCNEDLMSIYELIGIVFKILKISIPLIIIAFGILDFYKSVVSVDDIKIKKSAIILSKRVVAGILIFLLPSIILFIFDSVGFDKQSSSCIYSCVLDTNNCNSSQENNVINNNNNNDSIINDSNYSVDYSIYVD